MFISTPVHSIAADSAPRAAGMPMHMPKAAFTIKVLEAPGTAGNSGDLRFSVLRPDGTTVTQFDVEHEKQLHLFSVSDLGAAPPRRFGDFQHLHPDYQGDGTWTLHGYTAARAGATLLFGSFSTGGVDAVANGSIAVGAGAVAPARDESRGYTATVVHTMKMDGAVHAVVQLVRPDGTPVAAVDPYLGAPAHWALFGASGATTAADAAHAHPMGDLTKGTLSFHVMPRAGERYQGWLQFQPKGEALVTVPVDMPA